MISVHPGIKNSVCIPAGATELTGLLTGQITPQSYAYPSHILQQAGLLPTASVASSKPVQLTLPTTSGIPSR